MQYFLKQYVEFYLRKKDKLVDNQLIILPSKRSVSALKNKFANHTESLWLPEIIDIVTFIENISRLNILDHNETILEFYKVYKDIHKNKDTDSFEIFNSWASILIGDFNEIDRFLVDSIAFFEHYKALKRINYFGEENTEMIKSYIAFWEDMPKYYNRLKSHLLQTNKAYQGLAYRFAAENIDDYLNNNTQNITFLGFNALNAAEELIIESCLKRGHTKVVWDIDKYYLTEKQHPSNTFIKKYQKKWQNYSDHLVDLNIDSFKLKKDIEILSSPKNIGQAKTVANILQKMSSSEIENTAIILNDENLLHPLLNSIPIHIKDVNITMGLSLKQSPITDFFLNLTNHQKSAENSLDFNFLKNLFDHNLLNNEKFSDKNLMLTHLEKQNLKSIPFSHLLDFRNYEPEMLCLLNCLDTNQKPIDFIENLNQFVDILLNLEGNSFRTYLLAFRNILAELKPTFESYPDFSIMAFIILFKEKLDSEKLSFKGSKTKGLQIMGMLESRLLDFENIILTSVNEGILPSGKTDNSYITYNLKKQYGLPTHTEKDAIYAYHFFRLLQRAKKCYLIYDNDQSGFNKGEKSRFITYLQVFKTPQHQLSEQQFSLSTQLKARNLIEIEKTPEVIDELNNLAESGFSPTALTKYIMNPIDFYKRYILKVKEDEQLEDVINHKDFGTLIHNTIENLYKNAGVLDEEKLKLFKKKTDKLLKSTFDDIYAKGEYETGANRIQLEIAKAYLNKFYDRELYHLKKSKTEIIRIEEAASLSFKTTKHNVLLKGKIDRVDRCGEDLRIIDLKTGKVNNSDLKFNDFEDLITDYDYSKAFQILFYAMVYSRTYNVKDIKAGVISFKNLNSWFMPLKWYEKQVIDEEMIENFENYLSKLIDEILDPNIPFKEKEVNF